jgi:hypothetical protein
MLPCPACGFETVQDIAYGSYTICEVCGWEDDSVQLANPCSGGGANGRSLAEAQAKVLEKYPLDMDLAKGASRSRAWRPLNVTEIAAYERQRQEKHWSNMAIIEYDEAYWVKSHNSPLETVAQKRRST